MKRRKLQKINNICGCTGRIGSNKKVKHKCGTENNITVMCDKAQNK
jgi:hypothetical protein